MIKQGANLLQRLFFILFLILVYSFLSTTKIYAQIIPPLPDLMFLCPSHSGSFCTSPGITKVNYSFTIKNQGTANAPSTTVHFVLGSDHGVCGNQPNGDYIFDKTIPALSAGLTYVLSGTISDLSEQCGRGIWQLEATVDPNNQIAESNENNNFDFINYVGMTPYECVVPTATNTPTPTNTPAPTINVSYGIYTYNNATGDYGPSITSTLYGRLNSGDSWHLLAQKTGITESVSAYGTLYDDFAIQVSNVPSGWTNQGSYMLGTPPHQNCNEINVTRQECYGVRSSGVYGAPFRWVFSPIPTPTNTPTPHYSYCQSGACKIGTTPGLTSCEGIQNGCYCRNVSCLGNNDCVYQTGANSCNKCINNKCAFATDPTPTPTKVPVTPTPTLKLIATPTPSGQYSYCQSGACKTSTTPQGLTTCAGIRNGCYCLNVKCLVNNDCIFQTGANSCNKCVNYRCSF